ncbi:hypothetical protein Q7P37_001472 [Cladosporium fusiforme]
MTTNSERRVIRPLSKIECWQTALHQLDAYYGTTVACRYMIPATLTGNEKHNELVRHVDRALVCTVIHHPMLRVGLAEADANAPYWVEIEGIDLYRHVTWHENASNHSNFEKLFQKTCQAYLDTKFTELETLAGWKVAIFRRNETELDIIFGWNHSNCDGISGKIFHRTLLQYLNDPSTETRKLPFDVETRFISATATTADLPPPQEDISEYSLSWTFLASTLWRELAYPWITGDHSSKALWSPIRPKPYETHRATAWLSATSLSRVLEKCRGRDTTLTGLLHGITLVFFAKLLGPDEAKAFVSQTPLNQRRHTAPNSSKFPDLVPDDTMANYVSILMHGFSSALLDEIRALPGGSGPGTISAMEKEHIIWTAATSVRADIQRQLDKGTKDDFCGLMKLIPDLRSHFYSELEKPRMATWLVSNLGALDGGLRNHQNGSWAIGQAEMSLGSYVNGPVCKLNVVSVLDGELAVDVTWQAGVIDDATGQKLASEIEAWLQTLGSV